MLTFAIQSHRGVEQLVARRAHNPEAGGSSPSPATNFLTYSFPDYKGTSETPIYVVVQYLG